MTRGDQHGADTSTDLGDWFVAHRFLAREAELLDENRLDEWFEMLAHEIRYVMPVRVSVERARLDRGIDDGYVHFDEDHESLRYRVTRVQEVDAHAEAVPSRTRRFVTNVQCERGPGTDTMTVRSYLHLTRSQGSSPEVSTFSAARHDVLRLAGDEVLLSSRRIIGDQSTLGMLNLAVFL